MLCSGPPIFRKEVMSCDRFQSIMNFLRFSFVQQVRKAVPGMRIEPYLEMLRERCQWVMRPHKSFAVDEALILWNDRLSVHQIKKIKIWCNHVVPFRYGLEWIFLELHGILWKTLILPS
ncbi:hypothetical protein E2C01_087880 [Portunus trituberculatus]|uniref:PiggyBac transposable element-derived protein domain-containing protein n=1 Tax=Portunus trituberculatus TaxID=210409 RepID=A0A5B7JKH8_PORTR|nr:hypothetical protein [Portunus trituberculatus]